MPYTRRLLLDINKKSKFLNTNINTKINKSDTSIMINNNINNDNINNVTNNVSVIKEIYDLQDFKEIIQLLSNHNQVNKETLTIFDVDDVLIMPSHEDDFRHPYRIDQLKLIIEQINNNPYDFEKLQSVLIANRKLVLIDNEIIQIFKILTTYNVPTIALTAMGTGKFGVIDSMEAIRIKELDDLGISFTTLSPFKGKALFDDLQNIPKFLTDLKGTPSLDSGIIFTAGIDKAVTLEYIFKKYNYYPKVILFIDDLLFNLDSLQRLANKLNINFYGFHYKAVSLKPLPIINDENLERLRFSILQKEYKWLGYNELK